MSAALRRRYGRVARVSDAIIRAALANPFYRHVIATAPKYQIALMSIPVGDDVGEESHAQKQTIIVISGRARAHVGGKRRNLREGDTLIVPPGATHNVVNTGSESLKLYTAYEPPAHPEGVIEVTKADAR